MKPRKRRYHSRERRRLLNYISLVILGAVLMLLLIPQLYAANPQLDVHVDRAEIEMGDVLKLKIQTNFETTGTPDFSALEDQFEILGRQRSSRIEITNGRYKAFSRWDLHLTPRQTGELAIPPFEVDNAISAPLTITVTAPSKNPDAQQGPSFVESFVDAKSVYVQQQVHYTLRFYHLGQFINGNIRPPRFENALSFSLRNQFQYQKQIGPHRYQVYEWTWVFYPQKSGQHTLPPQGFDGRIQYRGKLRLVQDRTQPITLEVKPVPDAFPSDAPWLPAREVNLKQTFEGLSKAAVGDTLSRKITLQANGLLASQLPEIQTTTSEGLSLYPKKPSLDNQAHRQSVISERQQTIEAIARQAGKQHFEALTLHWWNTQTDQLETLTLPSRPFSVREAAGAQGQVFLPEQTPAEPETSSATEGTDWTPPKWWLWALVPLILLSLFALMRYRQPTRKHQSACTEKDPSRNAVTAQNTKPADRLCAPDTLEPIEVYRQLHQRLQANPPLNQLTVVQDLKQALQAHLFAAKPLTQKALITMKTQVCEAESPTHKEDTQTASQLQPLYPHKTNQK
ncbi:MAG: BatD family protein [Hydrogenovibrio sp.]|uniref:BatD family protein n=1 Tax=Hydrogenovibrio sp. TaxID=2065821 RepID=UPI00286FBE7C|nr:BatD family protein [Hydrogenovibrio sp.]MDR9498245.1 BatD family protein [Hydrogenovibrio sp.]